MLTLSLLTMLVAAPPVTAELRGDAKVAVVQHCQVNLIQDVEVPALETGPLVAMNAVEGQLVQKDDLLAQIDDRQAQLQKQSAEAERDAAQAKADDDIDVRYATKSYELAEAELNQDLEIKKKSPGAVSSAEIERKKLIRMRELLGIDRAKLERHIAQLTAQTKTAAVGQADEIMLRRRILAPFNGLVVEVLKEPAEWVNAGEPVFRVIQMDRLRVEGKISAAEFDPIAVANRPVTVEITLAGGRREQFTGSIVWVDPRMLSGNLFRVRAEVDNRMERNEPLLRPGMTVRMLVNMGG